MNRRLAATTFALLLMLSLTFTAYTPEPPFLISQPPQAHATSEGIENGGFETGDFTGWAIGNSSGCTPTIVTPGYSGTYAANLTSVNSTATTYISQGWFPPSLEYIASASTSFAINPSSNGTNTPSFLGVSVIFVNGTGFPHIIWYVFSYNSSLLGFSNSTMSAYFILANYDVGSWTVVSRNVYTDAIAAFGAGVWSVPEAPGAFEAVSTSQPPSPGANSTQTLLIDDVSLTYSTACLTYDTRIFSDPIVINDAVTWHCVDYTIPTVAITSTGSLDITDSIIRVGIISNAGFLRIHGTITPQLTTTVATSSTLEMENSTITALEVYSEANVTIGHSLIGIVDIHPEGNVRIVGFNPVFLTGDYDFTAWNMTAPHIVVHSSSVTQGISVSLAYGASATIIQSALGGLYASGSVTITSSEFAYTSSGVSLTAGTSSITNSTVPFLNVSGSSTCVVTSSQAIYLTLTGSTSDHISVTGFNETRNDGGNYNYDSWGFASLHVTTSASAVAHVSLSAGTVQVSGSELWKIRTENGGHATILRSNIGFLDVGNGEANATANATDSNIACRILVGNNGVVRLLNVTENAAFSCSSVSNLVDGTGVLDTFWYTFANVYDASTRQPISGVSLTIQDSLGHDQAATLNATARFTTQEYRMLASGTTEYTPYAFTFSKAGYNPTVVILQHFSNPVLSVYLQQATTSTTTETITTGTNTTGTGGLSIAFGSAHVTVQPGGTAQFTVAVSSSQLVQVTLTVTEIPTGWRYTFTPSTGEVNPQFVSTLTITTDPSTLPQAYAVMVNATGDNGESAIASIIVEVASTTSTTTSSPKCVIATAAYGSEMASEVVYMRHVRDELIGSTVIGRSIVQAWNTFYYSWSPPVAATIAQSSDLQALFRILLLPLVGIIHVTAFAFTALGSGDLASVIAFIVTAALSISIYITAPALVIRESWRRNKRRRTGGASEQ